MRRTHRRYADRPVPEPLLRLLLAAAFSASSKSDFQQASVVHVEDRVERDRLAALVPDMPWIGSAPVFLVFAEMHAASSGSRNYAAIARRQRRHSKGSSTPPSTRRWCMQTFVLAAETAGLGCCPISALRNHRRRRSRQYWACPDKVFPVAGLCVGYPAAAGYVSMRLPLEVTVHSDRYDDARSRRGCRQPMTPGAARATRSRASSNARRRSSGMPRFMAGRRTRRGKPPCPKDRVFRLTCAPAASTSNNGAGTPYPGSWRPEDYMSAAVR